MSSSNLESQSPGPSRLLGAFHAATTRSSATGPSSATTAQSAQSGRMGALMFTVSPSQDVLDSQMSQDTLGMSCVPGLKCVLWVYLYLNCAPPYRSALVNLTIERGGASIRSIITGGRGAPSLHTRVSSTKYRRHEASEPETCNGHSRSQLTK